MILVACKGLGVVLDTSVFICWCDNEIGYGQIVEVIINDNLYIVICESLQREYLRQLHRRFVGASYQVLRRKLEQLSSWGILKYAVPVSQDNIQIHRKDQHILECALNDECLGHFIITENQDHFVSTTREYLLPVIMSKDLFLDSNNRQNACGDVKRIIHDTRRIRRRRIQTL